MNVHLNNFSSVLVDPGMIGAPRSGSPLSTRTSPLEQFKFLQPIGGERKKGSGRSGLASNVGSYANLWSFNTSPGTHFPKQIFYDWGS